VLSCRPCQSTGHWPGLREEDQNLGGEELLRRNFLACESAVVVVPATPGQSQARGHHRLGPVASVGAHTILAPRSSPETESTRRRQLRERARNPTSCGK